MFRNLLSEGFQTQLIVVGDGPYRKEMHYEMKGLPCCFTGYLKGNALASIYASSDLFVFPSTTDTFGNVVLEAQASGLPVIVTDKGGPCENMILNQTGIICHADDTESLLAAVRTLITHPLQRKQMGIAARKYVESRSFENAFLSLWELYQNTQSANPVLPRE
jgi:glycosyltransferase involved in cell wall biosynthesis